MFSAGTAFVFNNIDVVSAVQCSSLRLAVPAVFKASAGENMLAAHGENVQLVLLYISGGDGFENVVQSVAVRSECIGNGKQRAVRIRVFACVGRGGR